MALCQRYSNETINNHNKLQLRQWHDIHDVVPFLFYAKMLVFEEFLKYTSHTSLRGSQPA